MKKVLLVCIYEISGDIVFKYGIYGCLALVTIVNPICCNWEQANKCFNKIYYISLKILLALNKFS